MSEKLNAESGSGVGRSALVRLLAASVDNCMMLWFRATSCEYRPCGRLQTWARMTRQGILMPTKKQPNDKLRHSAPAEDSNNTKNV